MKKLFLLPFLVFGQFLTHAQKPAKKAQQVITLNLMVAGPVHLPKIKTVKEKDKPKDKDSKQALKDELDLFTDKNLFIDKQVIETVVDDKKPEAANNSAKNKSVLYTISTL